LAERGQSVGYYGAEQLDFGERLSVSGALRYDKFRPIDRTMTHPSLSVAWVAHRADSGFLNQVRLRAAYGSAGRELPAFLESFFIVPPLSRHPPAETRRGARVAWHGHVPRLRARSAGRRLLDISDQLWRQQWERNYRAAGSQPRVPAAVGRFALSHSRSDAHVRVDAGEHAP